jgi:hypothetical protein
MLLIIGELPEQNPCAASPVGAPGIVIEFDAALTHLPEAVAFAVITSPVARVRPVLAHAPLVTVVVPNEVEPALNTSMVVPSASELVPFTVEVVALVMEVMTGAADFW